MFGQVFNFGAIASVAKTVVDFLVVSGGGGSSDTRAGHIGGAGAGGVLTSFGSNTPGTTGSIQESLEISPGQSYTITVGAGGYDNAGYGDNRENGGTSSIAGSDITSVAPYGGGDSGFINYWWVWGPDTASNMGSAGGGGWDGPSHNNSRDGADTTTTAQGHNGADPTTRSISGTTYYFSGSGGGAGGHGTNGSSSNPTGPKGGVGLISTILTTTQAASAGVGQVVGSNVYYAGGGAGTRTDSGNDVTLTGSTTVTDSDYYGGLGGGGRPYNNGIANTGGGAAGTNKGGGYSNAGVLQGGSGCVILKMPTDEYTGVTSGNPSVFTSGSDTILAFTGSGVYKHAARITGNQLSFLAVAGGASGGGAGNENVGGRAGGGGGAGGYKTSFDLTSGGNSTAPSNFNLSAGTYTITIGAGGASLGSNVSSRGNAGSSSTIVHSVSGSLVSTTGGGGGGSTNSGGGTGGSGGGGGAYTGSVSGAGTTGEGYSGYNVNNYLNNGAGLGGGGASEKGQSANGGDGLSNTISGSSVTYAGGGGGGGSNGTTIGNGGDGGGGYGQPNTSTAPNTPANTQGHANTGGGGGGASTNPGSWPTVNDGAPGAGGSGIVILRLKTAKYSGTVTGSPTVTTSGDETIIKFTASGTYVHS